MQLFGRFLLDTDQHFPGTIIRERIFQGIRCQFIENQRTGNSHINMQGYWFHLKLQFDFPRVNLIGLENVRHQFPNVLVKADPTQIFRLIDFFMDQGHRLDPVLTFLNQAKTVRIFGPQLLHRKKARNHLEVVFDPMVNFPQQGFFFIKRLLQALFKHHPLADVPQNHRVDLLSQNCNLGNVGFRQEFRPVFLLCDDF